jgi:hypothetical protein
MRKRTILFLLAVLCAAWPSVCAAQPANSLGIRFTGSIGFKGDTGFNEYPGFGAELSYQRFFTPKTRIEADLGMRFYDYNSKTKRLYPAILAATSFQWRWPIGRTAGFYAGPVVQFGRPYFWFGAGVQTGFDWQFEGPLQLSVDLRPTYSWWSGFDVCLSFGIRYSFGSGVASRANLKSSSGR